MNTKINPVWGNLMINASFLYIFIDAVFSVSKSSPFSQLAHSKLAQKLVTSGVVSQEVMETLKKELMLESDKKKRRPGRRHAEISDDKDSE